MHSTTLQLAVRGKPSAFDLNCDHDICVVASPGCLTFFHLAGLGSPRHVIHYEQPQQIRQLRYQKYGSLAALRGGVISLWDPSKSLRPLIGFVQSPGWITDLNWNPLNHNILATSSDSGEGVSLWDVRSPTYSTMQMSAGQVATSVEWCPSNSNLLAACADSQNVFIWDIRMASFNTLFDSSTGERNGTEVTTIPRSLAGGAICCCWSDGDDRQTGGLRTNEPQKSAATTLIVGRTNGSVEWWDTRSAPSASAINKTSNHGDCPLVETACSASLPPGSIDGSSIMLAVQMGGGVVISRRQGSIAMKGAAVGVPSNDSKRMIGAEGVLQSKASLPADILSNSSTRDGTNDIGSIVSTSDYRMDIILRGYPIGGLTHSGAVVPPEGETETSIYGTSPNFLLATCCEPILGMRWGNSGRLMPSAQGGLDLHMMTDSAALHIIKIPKETLDRCSSDGKGDGYSSRSTELVSGSINVVDAKPKYALKKSVVMASGPFDFQAQSQNPAGRHAATVGKSTVPFRSGSEGEGLHLANLGYENDTSKTEFWGLLQKEVLGLEEVLQRGQLEQLSISRVDQHARQVTLEVNKGFDSAHIASSVQASVSQKSRSLPILVGTDSDPYLVEQAASLIISFPSKFPLQGAPSYTIRGTGMNSNASAFSAELTAVMIMRSEGDTTGFLISLASCFLNRVTQIWNRRKDQELSSLTLQKPEALIMPAREREGKEHADTFVGGTFDDDSDKESDSSATNADIIDPMAYRIPCPRSSGATFSALGFLLCFGGASLSLADPSCTGLRSKKSTSALVHMPYPKTLADLLVAERIRAEQLTIRASEEAEANALAAVELELIAQNQRTRSNRSRTGKKRWGSTAGGGESYDFDGSSDSDSGPAKHHGNTDEEVDSSSDESEGEALMSGQINRDGFASLEEGLQCMGKLDGVEVVPKSFIYSPVQNLSPYRERPQVVSQDVGSKKGPVTPRPQSSITPTSLAQLAAATGAGPGHGQRHRPLGATEASLTQTAGSMSVNPASPNPKLNSAFSTNDSSLVPNRQISRSGSDNQVLAGPSSMKSSTHSIAGSSSSYLGGGSSLLHLSISNPEDSLEMLGASLDLHQEEGDRERSSYRTDVEDKHGHDTYEEVDPDDDASTEEIAERGSIAMSSRPFRIKLYQVAESRAQLLAFYYTLGPLPCRPSDDLPLLWGLRATACRQNAAAMETVEAILSIRSMKGRNGHGRLTQTSGRVGCYGTVRVVQQIWSLLASCIEVMATNRIAGENGSRRGNCVPPSSASSSLPDSMPLGDGSDVNWSVSVLGRSLLCRCINLLRQNGDLQTLATVICVFGGSKQLVALMTEAPDVEQLLCTYAETLRQWNAILQATEVSKHMQPELLKSLALSRKRNHLVKGDSALDIADKSIGDDEVVDFVTLVGLGVNCPRCGTATECLHEDPLDGRTQERSSGDATVSGLVDEVSRDSRRKMNALWCSPCGDYALSCSLCQMAIRGAGYFCASCGHGGHTGHMREWFEQAVECAAGCGCRCGELAITGHNNASEKDRVLPRDKGSMEYWGGSHSPVKVDFLSEGSRSSNDRDERQSSGKGYFLYDSDNATESTDSKDVSTRSESEYNSDDDDEEYCRNSEDAVDGNTNEQDQRTRTDVDDSYQSFNDWDNEG